MLKHLNVEAEVITSPEKVRTAQKIILPGVGKWDTGMHNLNESDLVDALNKRVLEDKIPVLGICLGMQLLLESSDEGRLPGLGWIHGKVRAFDFSKLDSTNQRLAIPHMGWNTVSTGQASKLTESVDDKSKFYFVHSFYAEVEHEENILLTSHYGHTFSSGISRDNIFGLQFHPEKSHRHGMEIMKSFSRF